MILEYFLLFITILIHSMFKYSFLFIIIYQILKYYLFFIIHLFLFLIFVLYLNDLFSRYINNYIPILIIILQIYLLKILKYSFSNEFMEYLSIKLCAFLMYNSYQNLLFVQIYLTIYYIGLDLPHIQSLSFRDLS